MRLYNKIFKLYEVIWNYWINYKDYLEIVYHYSNTFKLIIIICIYIYIFFFFTI